MMSHEKQSWNIATLSLLMASASLTSLTVLKIDVEGHEWASLETALDQVAYSLLISPLTPLPARPCTTPPLFLPHSLPLATPPPRPRALSLSPSRARFLSLSLSLSPPPTGCPRQCAAASIRGASVGRELVHLHTRIRISVLRR
jgi:hypothetical protein